MQRKQIFLKWIVLAALLLWLFPACAARQPQPDPRVQNLENELAEANRQLSEMYHRMSVVQFMVDSHEKTIRELKHELAQTQDAPAVVKESGPPGEDAADTPPRTTPPRDAARAEAPPRPAPQVQAASAEALYEKARRLFQAGDYARAAPVFQKIADQYPGHDLADNALYWRGECFYSQKEYQQAIDTFQKIPQQYPDGGKMPDALLKIGLAYLSLGDRQNADLYLKRVLKNYPFHPAGAKSEATLNQLK